MAASVVAIVWSTWYGGILVECLGHESQSCKTEAANDAAGDCWRNSSGFVIGSKIIMGNRGVKEAFRHLLP